MKVTRQIEDRRIRGIAKQIGLLKTEIQREKRKNITLFLLGLTIGLLTNVLLKLLGFNALQRNPQK